MKIITRPISKTILLGYLYDLYDLKSSYELVEESESPAYLWSCRSSLSLQHPDDVNLDYWLGGVFKVIEVVLKKLKKRLRDELQYLTVRCYYSLFILS